jgi:hypothetical protein
VLFSEPIQACGNGSHGFPLLVGPRRARRRKGASPAHALSISCKTNDSKHQPGSQILMDRGRGAC